MNGSLIKPDGKNDIFASMIHLGYLTYNEMNSSVRIPNLDVRTDFISVGERLEWI